MSVEILTADLDDQRHIDAIVELIDLYASTPAGRSKPLTENEKSRLAPGLRERPQHFVLLAETSARIVGVAVCIEGFSTFSGKPYVNIHDLAVAPECRSKGVGTRLIEAVIAEARLRQACKVTLEVHDSNRRAQDLYRRLGFGSGGETTWFLSKTLD